MSFPIGFFMLALGVVVETQGPYDDLIHYAASISGIDPALIAAHIMAESSFNSNAVHKDSDGVASYGLMQVRIDYGRKLLNEPALTPEMLIKPKLNILAGARFIQDNLRRWGNLKDAIAAYNAGIPRKNVFGKYTNSKGNTAVNDYVERVYKYYLKYKQMKSFKPIGIFGIDKFNYAALALMGILFLMFRR